MKQKLIKIIGIILVLLVIIVCISTMGNASAINPNSEKIAELSYQVNELESHKNLCLDNLPYKESVDNANGIHTYCNMYDELIMQYQEEIEKLKEWRPASSETEKDLSALIYDENGNCIGGIGCTREEREPGMLNESGDAQVMPNIVADTSHERFKKLCEAYGLDASTIWQVENHYGIKEGVIACITVAETSGGQKGYGKNNPGNVGNNDRGDRVRYALLETGLEKIAQTLNNKYLGGIQTLGCLSNAGSCQDRDNHGHRYATSNGNWERNMTNCLSTIYGSINPSVFTIRR